jgi:hypothetical protein
MTNPMNGEQLSSCCPPQPDADADRDDRDKRIFSTGCAGNGLNDSIGLRCLPADARLDENMKMTDCYFEKKDWRQCVAEVSSSPVHGGAVA